MTEFLAQMPTDTMVNGSSEFGGNADSAEMADLDAVIQLIANFPGGVPRSDKYHKPKRADRRYVTTGPTAK